MTSKDYIVKNANTLLENLHYDLQNYLDVIMKELEQYYI